MRRTVDDESGLYMVGGRGRGHPRAERGGRAAPRQNQFTHVVEVAAGASSSARSKCRAVQRSVRTVVGCVVLCRMQLRQWYDAPSLQSFDASLDGRICSQTQHSKRRSAYFSRFTGIHAEPEIGAQTGAYRSVSAHNEFSLGA